MKNCLIFCLPLLAAPIVQAAEAPSAAKTDVAVVQYRDTAQTYRIDGLVEATRQSTLSAQTSGRISEIHFDAGDRVKKGQILLRIDEREALQTLAGSQAEVLQARANLQNAEAAYERAQQLAARKFISQAALDKAQADYKVAQAQVKASEAQAGQSGLTHGYTSVITPYNGIIAARLVEIGEMVVPGKPLLTMFEPAGMRVIASIPQDRLSDIGAHPETIVEIPSLNRRIKAASTTIQPVADARTHSTQVRVNLPNNEAGIYPGMSVRVHFGIGKVSRLVIPPGAVVYRSEVTAVYVVSEKGEASLRQVRLGETTAEGDMEVLAGLNPGEKVSMNPVKAGMKP